MNRLRSTLISNINLPYEFELDEAIEFAGLTGYIPYVFICDLVAVATCKVLNIAIPDTEYAYKLYELVRFVQKPLVDTILIVKLLGQKYNLREIEKYAEKQAIFDLENISASFNYPFELKDISSDVKELLNITEDFEKEIEKLPDEVINILTITSGYGDFIKTSSLYTASPTKMESYGDIVRIPKHKYIDPLFDYKFSVKAYDYMTDHLININGDKLIIGYYIGPYISKHPITAILKLLGAIVLQYGNKKSVIVYSFYNDIYEKITLNSTADIIDYFSKPQQLKIFSINNTTALNTMISENRGDEIIFMPNINRDCAIYPGNAGLCKINILSFTGSKYNIKFANICKQTGGIFTTI